MTIFVSRKSDFEHGKRLFVFWIEISTGNFGSMYLPALSRDICSPTRQGGRKSHWRNLRSDQPPGNQTRRRGAFFNFRKRRRRATSVRFIYSTGLSETLLRGFLWNMFLGFRWGTVKFMLHPLVGICFWYIIVPSSVRVSGCCGILSRIRFQCTWRLLL